MAAAKQEHIRLIVSDEEKPKIEHPHGSKAKVVSVSLVDPKLAKAQVTAARLCGGTSTCLALHEV